MEPIPKHSHSRAAPPRGPRGAGSDVVREEAGPRGTHGTRPPPFCWRRALPLGREGPGIARRLLPPRGREAETERGPAGTGRSGGARGGAAMSAFSEAALERKLSELSNSQQSVQTLSLWLIHHRKHSALIVNVWERELRKGEPGPGPRSSAASGAGRGRGESRDGPGRRGERSC